MKIEIWNENKTIFALEEAKLILWKTCCSTYVGMATPIEITCPISFLILVIRAFESEIELFLKGGLNS